MLTDNFLSPSDVVLEQNSPVVNIGDKLVLFDTGMGTSQDVWFQPPGASKRA